MKLHHLLFIFLCASAFHRDVSAADRPNIVLVMPDDVGVGDYACLGNPVMQTPTVDAFETQSLSFTQFHVSPTCSPCRSALMSGRHEFKIGVTHTILERERMSLKTHTLAQMLKSVGHSTGIFGKWHLGDEEAYRPENRGFDEDYIHGGGGIGQTYPGSCGDAPGNTNFGVLLKKLGEWGIEKNTLVIFFTGDTGGTAGTKIFNGGLRGSKGSPYQGGIRATAFFRWPGGSVPAGAECDALTAHLDIFPTLAELTGARLSNEVKRQVEGRSLLPLLKNPKAEVTDRILVHHVGRWRKGGVEKSKFSKCAIQNSRFTLVNNTELYDPKADPGEKTNVFAAHPDVVANLRTAYDAWWSDVQPLLVNENAAEESDDQP